MHMHRLVGVAVFAAAWVLIADVAHAQRTRWPGDSPTRQEVMNGRVLGNPTGKSPTVPTFTIPQGGFQFGWGRRPYYAPGLAWISPYGVSYGARAACYRCGPFGCTCGTPVFSGNLVAGDALFGPAALFGQPPPAPRAAPRAPVPPVALAPAPQFDAGADALHKAWRQIDLGDRYLQEGRYREALSRYRRAIQAAPEMADARFRRTLAELALGNVERAADALQDGLLLDPDWGNSDFELGMLYSPDTMDAAAGAIQQRLADFPNDANARLLAGVMLHFTGRGAEAQTQFARADKVTGGASPARFFLWPADLVQEPQ